MQVVDNNGNVFGVSSIEIIGPDGKPKTIGGGGGGGGTNSNVLIDGGTFLIPTQNVLIDAGIF
jgi:hypothetical protein